MSSSFRHPSISQAGNSNTASPALIARINEKRQELESYEELRDLSAQLAEQMQALHDKLATVSGGAEGEQMLKFPVHKSCGIDCALAVALVLSNWQHILKAINMASSMSHFP